ncbi:hypothetical protein TNCV_1663471 [Trichonephila clavipes]|nr:hypothetical protein TNCV_1663471 [Trichonephila clavipes]
MISDESRFSLQHQDSRISVWWQHGERTLAASTRHRHTSPSPGVMESATKLGLGSSFRFQHDNDPKHTAETVKLWLLNNVPNQLHTPPQS